MPRWKREKARDMRKAPTPAEKKLYQRLKAACQYRVRRQVCMLGYIADFYIAAAKLVIECDGNYHKSRAEQDAHRDSVLASHGIQTIRVSNAYVLQEADRVVAHLIRHIDSRVADKPKLTRKPKPTPRARIPEQ
jgi:very-short-patch-repair endonuclease